MKNPYFQGVEQALAMKQFAKASDEQQYDSLNRGVSQFGAALGSHPTGVRRGFLENLAAFAPAMSQGNVAYLDSQKAAEASNAVSIKEALAREMEQRKFEMQERKEEENNFWKQRQYELGERRLDQQQQFQNEMLLRKERERADKERKEQEALDTTVNIDGRDFNKIKDKVTLRGINEDRKTIQDAKSHFSTIEKDFNKLQKDTQDNMIAPVGGVLSNSATWVKGKLGRLGADKFAEEVALRNNVEAELGKFNILLEKALTGRAMVQGMYDRVKAFYPDLNNDSLPLVKKKMDTIRHELDKHYQAADFSMKHKVLASPGDFENSNILHEQPAEENLLGEAPRQSFQPQQPKYNAQGNVLIKNLETGSKGWANPQTAEHLINNNQAEFVYDR